MEKEARKRHPSVQSRSPSPILEASEEAELLAELAFAPATDVELLQPASFLNVWIKRFDALYKLGRSRALLPDSVRHHPYTLPVLGAFLAALYMFPGVRLYIGLVLFGIILGYVYVVPEAMVRPKGSKEESFLESLLSPRKYSESMDKHGPFSLSISPRIDAELDALLDDIITEIVNPWFVPLCKSGENEFQSCVRSTINAVVMNLIKFGSAINNDTTTLLIYGVTNALIVHMEEYRRFETSKLPLDRFVMSHRSRRTHHKNYSEELEHLRQVAGLLLKKLAPKQESRSILLNSLMKEIISGNALAGLIDRIADPDFINEQIVKHMQDPEDAMPKVDLGWNMVILKRIIVL